MKNLILLAFLFFGFKSSAQIGVVAINENDSIPYGQWYNIIGDAYNSKIFFYDDAVLVDATLSNLLRPWDLGMTDAEVDEEGDLYWVVDNENGYTATVYLIKDGENSIITIITEEN